MGLFTPIYMKSELNAKKQRKALEKVSAIADPDELCRIALNAPVPAVGAKAVQGLEDAGKLRRVAWEAGDLSVRRAAVEKLTDVGALVSLAGSEPQLFDHCLWRLKALGDRQGLAQLFIDYEIKDEGQSINAIDREYRRAVEKLKGLGDQEVIEAVARRARKAEIRAGAAALMEHPMVLAEIAKKDRDAFVRQAAVTNPRFSDVEVLAGIAQGDSPGTDTLRWSAALRLTELAPERAVGPLVELMKKLGDAKAGKGVQTAVQFLEARYRDAASGEERERIAALRNGKYGFNWNGPCWHEDASVHFDIPR